jgi:hypothetical protein
LKDLTLGLKAFHDIGTCHGDVQPSTVFVLDNKTLKLVDTTFLNDGRSGFERRHQEMDYSTPLSPQAVNCLLKDQNLTLYDKEKNDIWAAGKIPVNR